MAEYFKNSYKAEQAPLPLSVKNVGFQQCTPGYRWGAGMRDHYLLHYVVSGRGTYTVEGRSFPVEAGQVFLAWPNTVLSYTADHDDPWEYYWLGFAGPDAAVLLSHTGLKRSAPVLSIGFGKTFQQYVTAIYDARGSDLRSRTQMLGYAYLLLGRLIEAEARPQESANPAARAAEFIENNYADQITIDDIAARAGVSRSWLYRCFMERFACSPAAYLRSRSIRTRWSRCSSAPACTFPRSPAPQATRMRCILPRSLPGSLGCPLLPTGEKSCWNFPRRVL